MRDWLKIKQAIEQAETIMLTTHENPDGDGIGSIVVFQHYLRKKSKDFRILMTSQLPEEFQFLDPLNTFEIYNEEKHSEWLLNVDLALLLDIGNYDRTGRMWEAIKQNGTIVANIDHHPYPNGHPFTINISDVNASATGELVYDFLNEIEPKYLTKEVYEAIYVAIMTDTGSFSYNNTNIQCHEIAAKAIEAGVDTAKLHQMIYGSNSRSKIKLLAAVADNIQYAHNGKVAWFVIDKEMMAKSGAAQEDVEGFTDFARSIKGVEVAFMIFENSTNSCRINFRSKGFYSINKVAQYFGGGGHSFAAGAKVNGTLSETIDKVLDKTIEIMKDQERIEK